MPPKDRKDTMIEKIGIEEFIPEDFIEDEGRERDTIPCPPPASHDFRDDDFPY